MRIIVFLLFLSVIISCRSTRKIGTAIGPKDSTQILLEMARKDSVAFINQTLQTLQQNRIDFRTFSAKINIEYRDAEDKKYDVNANLRMWKDSAVWISVNAILGIEGLRAMVTKDSVHLLDKQNKIYTARSVDYLQEVTALPLDLEIVQDLLIGNPVYLDSNVVSYSQNPGTLSLLSIGEWFKNLLTVSVSDKSLQRSKLDDRDFSRNRTADLTYSSYKSKDGVRFAEERTITVVEKKKLDIRLQFKQFEFNDEVSFPFSIPKNYKRN
jgi:hypothetical protein